MAVGRRQARSLTERTIRVGDETTTATHDMVMIVADAHLVTGHMTRRLDTTHETDGRHRIENVVDGLTGHRWQDCTSQRENSIRVDVWMTVHNVHDDNARLRDP